MSAGISPLRYPGGKASLAGILQSIIYANGLQGCVYVEPFSGGAGAGVKLLEAGHVERLVINDADPAVHAFWWSVMHRTDEFTARIHSTPLSIREWKRQREIYRAGGHKKRIDLGFAAFFLNRCNRSGIIKDGGPIGGVKQLGEWKIDARFNRENLAKRITEISSYGERITILKLDAQHLIENTARYCGSGLLFAYADPPYFVKGRNLYMNHFDEADHASFAKAIQAQKALRWVMTYDDVSEINKLYIEAQRFPFTLRYSTHKSSKEGGELLIAPNDVLIPKSALEMLSAGGFFRKRTSTSRK